jgi:hypothetical protein
VDIVVSRALKDTRWNVVIGEELADDADARCLEVAIVVVDGAEVEEDLAARGGDDGGYVTFDEINDCNEEDRK